MLRSSANRSGGNAGSNAISWLLIVPRALFHRIQCSHSVDFCRLPRNPHFRARPRDKRGGMTLTSCASGRIVPLDITDRTKEWTSLRELAHRALPLWFCSWCVTIHVKVESSSPNRTSTRSRAAGEAPVQRQVPASKPAMSGMGAAMGLSRLAVHEQQGSKARWHDDERLSPSTGGRLEAIRKPTGFAGGRRSRQCTRTKKYCEFSRGQKSSLGPPAPSPFVRALGPGL